MLESLLGSDSSSRIVDKHALEKIDSELIGGHNFRKLLGLPHGESLLEVWERGYTGPHLLVGRSKRAEDAEEFVNFTIAREKCVASKHLSEDATQAPNVDRSRVVAGSKQNLGCSVPQGDDLYGSEGAGWLDILI